MRSVASWIGKRWKRCIVLTFLALFLLLNVLAYRHAYAMTHFVRGAPPVEGHAGLENMGLVHKVSVLLAGPTVYRPENTVTPADLGLAYEAHSFPGDSGALEGWYVPHADAHGLVLLFHGYGSCKSEMLPEVKGFHDLGYACFLIDFSGSGGSAGDATTVGYGEAGDVGRTVDYARGRWPGRRLILFGQSMGAAAVLRAMAANGVRPDATVLECPFDTLLHTVEARFALLGVPAFPGAELLVFWGGVQNGFNGFAHNPADYARGAAGPVLMLHGAEDTRVTRTEAEAIYANLPGEKELHFFDGLGHESYAAKRPVEWKEWVGRFLDRK